MAETLGTVIFFIFFNASNPSSHTMTPGFTEHLAEMSITRFLGVKRGRLVINKLTALCKPTI
jgi:hypothetical protein